MTREDLSVAGDSADQSTSEERYRIFIENIDDGIYETDIYGDFTYFNDALCKIFARSREEIQGRNFGEFMDQNHLRMGFIAAPPDWHRL